MSLNIDEIYAEMGISPEEIEKELEIDAKINSFKDKNKPVASFKDDAISACLENHFSYYRPTIHHWEFGAYFIVDSGYLFSKDAIDIFSKKSFLPLKFIHEYKRELTEKTKGKSHEEASEIKKELLKELEKNRTNYIYKRESKEKFFKFYIYEKYKKLFETNGYNVKEESSYFKRVNKETRELEYYTVYSVRLDKETFINMCRHNVIIPKGRRYNSETGEEIAIKKGRPSKAINLKYGDLELHFNSIDEVGECLGVSRSTVKRSLKDKMSGDVIILKKKRYILA